MKTLAKTPKTLGNSQTSPPPKWKMKSSPSSMKFFRTCRLLAIAFAFGLVSGSAFADESAAALSLLQQMEGNLETIVGSTDNMETDVDHIESRVDNMNRVLLPNIYTTLSSIDSFVQYIAQYGSDQFVSYYSDYMYYAPRWDAALQAIKRSLDGDLSVELESQQWQQLNNWVTSLQRTIRANMAVAVTNTVRVSHDPRVTVTNFLGNSDRAVFNGEITEDVIEAIQTALGFPPNGFNGVITSSPLLFPIPESPTMGEYFLGTIWNNPSGAPTNLLSYQQYILNAISRISSANSNALSGISVQVASGLATSISVQSNTNERVSAIDNTLSNPYTGPSPESVSTNNVPPDISGPGTPDMSDFTSAIQDVADALEDLGDLDITPDLGGADGDPVFYLLRPESVFFDLVGVNAPQGISVDFSKGQLATFITKCNAVLTAIINFFTPILVFLGCYFNARWILNFFHHDSDL